MKQFFRSEDGYVLLFAILVLPVFVWFGLLIIDMSRGNNAHGDLQSAADALALAGARELDGMPTGIERAKDAMEKLQNSVSMLGMGADAQIALIYEDSDGNAFTVRFLSEIPPDDATVIDEAWLALHEVDEENDPELAKYVYVLAQSRDLETVFFNPITWTSNTVPIAAYAVAKSISAVCKIPPLYICNPWEYDSTGGYIGDQLQDEFAQGSLHGRLLRLHQPGPSTHTPGNFGFLRVPSGAGASSINDLFAGAPNFSCYSSERVITNTGAANSMRQGINTRFDMYEGAYGGGGPRADYVFPAENVRKGGAPEFSIDGSGNPVFDDECVTTGGAAPNLGDDHVFDISTWSWNANGVPDFAYGFPDNDTMAQPNESVAGAAIGTTDTWNIEEYFHRNYGTPVPISSAPLPGPNDPDPRNVISSFVGLMPSRYDVYRTEINKGWYSLRAEGDPSYGVDVGETGSPACGASMSPPRLPDAAAEDRRTVAGAIIDCKSQAAEGGGINYYNVNTYARMFLARPMYSYNPSADATIDLEIIDITGPGGDGSLETFIRDEAVLVR